MHYVTAPWIDLRSKPEPHSSGSLRVKDPLQETQLLKGEKINILQNCGQWLFIEALDQPVYEKDSLIPYKGWILNENIAAEPPLFAQKPIIPYDQFINLALTFTNVPYLWGGLTFCFPEDDNSRGIDCSGLIHYLYRRCGKVIPRNSADQYKFSQHIQLKDLQPRDLLFLSLNKIYHVMIYLGGEIWFEATSDSMNVRQATTTQKLGIPLSEMIEGLPPKDNIQAFAGKINL
ncbi:MAG: C40 family peptidase [Parachlamydiales bacterium]|jgi:hypothetical protein